jgi:hypothetical protein
MLVGSRIASRGWGQHHADALTAWDGIGQGFAPVCPLMYRMWYRENKKLLESTLYTNNFKSTYLFFCHREAECTVPSHVFNNRKK